MHCENIPTVIIMSIKIAGILGLIAAELLPDRAKSVQICSASTKRSTTRQLLGLGPDATVTHARTCTSVVVFTNV